MDQRCDSQEVNLYTLIHTACNAGCQQQVFTPPLKAES